MSPTLLVIIDACIILLNQLASLLARAFLTASVLPTCQRVFLCSDAKMRFIASKPSGVNAVTTYLAVFTSPISKPKAGIECRGACPRRCWTETYCNMSLRESGRRKHDASVRGLSPPHCPRRIPLPHGSIEDAKHRARKECESMKIWKWSN